MPCPDETFFCEMYMAELLESRIMKNLAFMYSTMGVFDISKSERAREITTRVTKLLAI